MASSDDLGGCDCRVCCRCGGLLVSEAMSLINQVLLDLEKRHAAESERPLPAYVRVVPGRGSSSIATSVLTGTALLVFIAIAAFVYYRSITNTSSTDVLLLNPRAARAQSSNPLPVPPVPAA